jgi:APA family basic amino acid/polyamine antiporter
MTLLTMGCVIATSIFVTPQVVARDVKSQNLLLLAWLLGGLFALCGSFAYAELAWRRPQAGGQYAYLRDAYHPGVAFIYGWCTLLVSQTGAMASVAVIFARYFAEVTGWQVDARIVTTVTIGIFTIANCFGVRTGSTLQNIFMISKIAAIGGLVICGWLFAPARWASAAVAGQPAGASLSDFGAAMVLVMFGYGGWHVATFMSGEVKDPQKNMPRGLILGALGVTTLYIGVNLVCARALGSDLATTLAPASAVMRLALGERGAWWIAVGITISAAGFLSQATLTTPRLYYAMARDGLFFKQVAWLHPQTRVPVVAILLQGAAAIVIALSGKYEEILRYVMSAEIVFGFLTVFSLFIFRRRDAATGAAPAYSAWGHPFTTVFFLLLSAAVALNSYYKHPMNSLIGTFVALSGVPVYFFWRKRRDRESTTDSLRFASAEATKL